LEIRASDMRVRRGAAKKAPPFIFWAAFFCRLGFFQGPCGAPLPPAEFFASSGGEARFVGRLFFFAAWI